MSYQKYYVKDVKEKSSEKLFNVISCFAGGGGSSTGYRLAGANILLINEFVEEAISTYQANFPDTKVLVDDIKKYSSDDFLEMAGIKVGELDLLDGSPPCSAFSLAGKRDKGWEGYVEDTRESSIDLETGEVVQTGELKKKDGIKKYSEDKIQESIEDLFLEYIRIAKGIQPKVIVAENVKGITFGESKKKLLEFINDFERIGYEVSYQVMNAADYGTPQARERTIFICVRKDVAETIGLNFMNISGIFPTKTVTKHVTMREAFEDIENDPEEIKMLTEFVEGSFQNKFLSFLPFNPEKPIKPSDKQFREFNPKGSCFNMIRPAPDLPSPTLTQQGQKKGLSGVFHYAENRKPTIVEFKRLMGMPEDFILTGDFDQQAERLGRMVAPKMMKEIANSIYKNVLEPYNKK
jgi:DNA (cytosine-5)-methyltransferase 1